MTGHSRRTWTSAFFVAGAFGATVARADDDPAGKAAAQVLFEQGRVAVEHGDFAAACPKFAESQRLDAGIGTGLWLADCYENNGQTASAWVTFNEAAAAAALKKDPREKVARERVKLLEPKLSRLSILVPAEAAVPGLEVRRDGVPLGSVEWGVPVPIDPGVHTVSAAALGREPWSTTVQMEPRTGTLQVTVPVLPPVLSAKPAAPPPAKPSPRDSGGSTQRGIGLIAGGVGLAGLIVGGILGLRAKSTYDDSNSGGHCLPDNQCDATGKEDRSNAYSLATASTVAVIGGAAALGGGAIVYATTPGDATVNVTPNARTLGFSLTAIW